MSQLKSILEHESDREYPCDPNGAMSRGGYCPKGERQTGGINNTSSKRLTVAHGRNDGTSRPTAAAY